MQEEEIPSNEPHREPPPPATGSASTGGKPPRTKKQEEPVDPSEGNSDKSFLEVLLKMVQNQSEMIQQMQASNQRNNEFMEGLLRENLEQSRRQSSTFGGTPYGPPDTTAPNDEILNPPVTLYANRGSLCVTDAKEGERTSFPPYSIINEMGKIEPKQFVFRRLEKVIRRDGKNVFVSSLKISNRAELEWFRKHPHYGVVFSENKHEVCNVNGDHDQVIASQIVNELSPKSYRQLCAMADERGVKYDKDAPYWAVRVLLLSKLLEERGAKIVQESVKAQFQNVMDSGTHQPVYKNSDSDSIKSMQERGAQRLGASPAVRLS